MENSALVKSVRDNYTPAKEKDTNLVKINVGKIETRIGWFSWKEKFIKNMKNKLGVGVTPILYVIYEKNSRMGPSN